MSNTPSSLVFLTCIALLSARPPGHVRIALVIDAAEAEPALFEELDATFFGQPSQAGEVALQVAALAVKPDRQGVDRVALIVELEQRLHVHADRRLLVEEELDERPVAQTDL